jgi:type IV pilus assembly protein PilA
MKEKIINKNGFTLIELLAVILILGIIAIIAIPTVSKLVDNSRKEAFKDTAFGIIKTMDYTYVQNLVKDNKYEMTFTYQDGIEASEDTIEKLKYNGEKPKNGIVKVNVDGDVAIAIHNGKYCASKSYSDDDVSISKIDLAECLTSNEDITVGVITVANSDSPKVAEADYVVPAASLDAQTIINQAINAANLANKSVLLFDGTYTINDSILLGNNTRLKGESKNTIIKLENNHSVSEIDLIENKDTENRNISISNLLVDGNKDNQDSSYHVVDIKLTNVNKLSLNNIEVKGSLIEGIYLNTCTYAVIESISSNNNGYFQQDASGIQIDNSNNININNSVFENNGFHGILLSSSTNNIITNSIVRNNGYDGIRIQWDSKNNTFDKITSNNNFRGIYITTASETNIIKNTVFDSNYNGVCFNSSWENTISDSTIKNSTGVGVVTVEGSDYNYFRNDIYENNATNFQLIYEDQMMP